MTVVDLPEENRLVVVEDGMEAELVYRKNGRRLLIRHTGVPDSLSGRGIGGQLVSTAIERARADGLTVVPVCPFARSWIERHPEEVGSVPIARAP
jgi:predicted GNAT family acetyltransferase